MSFSPNGAMRRNGVSCALVSVGEMGHRTILLRLSAVLRNAVVMCRPLITPDNYWHKTTWPEFQPSLPPGQTREIDDQHTDFRGAVHTARHHPKRLPDVGKCVRVHRLARKRDWLLLDSRVLCSHVSLKLSTHS